VQALTTAPLKFTLTSPYMLAKTLLDTHYGDVRALTFALAEVLRDQLANVRARVIQVDEANLPGSPDDGAFAAEAINIVLSGVPQGVERAVHLCFGNYGGQTIQRSGAYRSLLPFLAALKADHVVLEFARRGYDELPLLRELPGHIGIGLGVIDIKDNEIELPDDVARRIEHAVFVLGDGRVTWVHPDCGFWMLHRSVADRKMRTLVEGRNLFEGRTA
jgi:5-methyltetrahydropteroyltriglutamate--homocysteine methyltransferase